MAIDIAQLAPTTRARILDSAFDTIAEVGLSGLTMEKVANRADLSRQTVYRYFPTRDDLLLALVLREEERFLDGTRAAFARAPDLERAIEDATTFVLRYARRHPLLDRLLETDAETLLPFLTTRGGPVVSRAREVVETLIRDKAPGLDRELVEVAADGSVRLLLSYAITPPHEPPEVVARALARIFGTALNTGLGKEAS